MAKARTLTRVKGIQKKTFSPNLYHTDISQALRFGHNAAIWDGVT